MFLCNQETEKEKPSCGQSQEAAAGIGVVDDPGPGDSQDEPAHAA